MQTQEFHFNINVKNPVEPLWAGLVDRWYQLDTSSYAIAQACYQLKDRLTNKLDFIYLAVAGGSNRADQEFVETQCARPAKFIYTLPNVPISIMCQVLQWQGQTRCVVCRENQFSEVIKEAYDFAQLEKQSLAIFCVDQKILDDHKDINVLLLNPNGRV